MVYVFNNLPYPIILAIFLCGLTATIYLLIKCHKYLKIVGMSAFIMLCVVGGAFGVILKTIEIYHVFSRFESEANLLLVGSLFIGLILLLVKAYAEFFKRFPAYRRYKKFFWIYILILFILLILAVIFVFLANRQ